MNLQTEIKPDLWEAIAQQYESKTYTHAILEAIHYMSNVIRDRANLDGDGASLVGQALGGANPLLRINKYQTETEKNEQKGIEQILRGVYQGIRNPRSHTHINDTKEIADAIILFINYVLRFISLAKDPFTIEEWIKRVFDPFFVKEEHYASLLVSEVPPKQCTDVLITLFQKKDSNYAENMKYVFSVLIKKIGNDSISEFIKVVSDELKVVQDDLTIKFILQILPASFWPSIDEAVRIRIENILINSISEGKYDATNDSCETGWLGTWAQDYVNYFLLQNQLYSTILKKLKRSREEKNYIAMYFLQLLPDTISSKKNEGNWYPRLRNNYIGEICKVASEQFEPNMIKDALKALFIFPKDWQKIFIEKLEPFAKLEPEYYKEVIGSLGDVPF
jgi:TIGR02391 family protein